MAWPPPCPGKGGTQTARSSYARWAAARRVARLDCLDGVNECVGDDALTDGAEHDAERPPFEVLPFPDHDMVDLGRPVGPSLERGGIT